MGDQTHDPSMHDEPTAAEASAARPPWGRRIERTEYSRLVGVVGQVQTSHAGNVILRVGHEVDEGQRGGGHGWEQTEHVTLTPDEALGLIRAMVRALGPSGRASVARALLEDPPDIYAATPGGIPISWPNDVAD